MLKYRIPYVVNEAPVSFHHAMPGEDLTPVPVDRQEDIEAVDAEAALAQFKQTHRFVTEIGVPALIE